MKKGIVLGVLALSTTAVFAMAGCDNKEVPKYTVTFDHDNNVETSNVVVEFKKGDTQLSSIPAVPADPVTGFAGVWDSFTLGEQNITVTAKYGTGTAENPYMVATATQFKKIVEDYVTLQSTEYKTAENGDVCEEAEATFKTETYPTGIIQYNKVGTSWEFKECFRFTNNSHFKLIADVDMSSTTLYSVANGFFLGEIDGGNYSLSNVNPLTLTATSGSIFHKVAGATFENLTIKLGENITTLVSQARVGNVRFENITVENATQNGWTTVNEGDNNESPFVNFVMNESNVTFKNCVNSANFINYSAYTGLFVGGYAKATATVNFDGCVANGEVVSKGAVAMFFGNPNNQKPTITMANCVYNGKVTAPKDHVNLLVAPINGKLSSVWKTMAETYNAGVAGELTFGSEAQAPAVLEAKHAAIIEGTNITLADTENLAKGTYTLVLSSYGVTNNNSTILTNIEIPMEITTNTNLVTFEGKYLGIQDLETFNAGKEEGEKLASAYSTGATGWTAIEGYNLKYKVVDGVYVVDYSKYMADNGFTSVTINTKADKLTKSIVCDTQEKIDFIVDFAQTNPTAFFPDINQVGKTVEQDTNKLTRIQVIFNSQPTKIAATYKGGLVTLGSEVQANYGGEGVDGYVYYYEFASETAPTVTEYDADSIKVLCKVGSTWYAFNLTTDLSDEMGL